jgi:hypothetical protein
MVYPSLAKLAEQNPQTKTWGQTTNPLEHDPTTFRYLVHQITDGAGPNFSIKDPGQFTLSALGFGPNQAEQPNLNGLDRVSASLIDPQHTATFSIGRWGYILSVPESDVIATSPRDIGRNAFVLSEEELEEKYPVLQPEMLLAQTDEYRHNEVLIRSGNIEISGVFYLGSEFPDMGPSHIDVEFTQLQRAARALTVPTIAI